MYQANKNTVPESQHSFNCSVWHMSENKYEQLKESNRQKKRDTQRNLFRSNETSNEAQHTKTNDHKFN